MFLGEGFSSSPRGRKVSSEVDRIDDIDDVFLHADSWCTLFLNFCVLPTVEVFVKEHLIFLSLTVSVSKYLVRVARMDVGM